MKPQNSFSSHPKLNARQLRTMPNNDIPAIPRQPMYLILDGVYDTYNIGGLFRLADALAMSGLFICGDSETPPNSRILKASIGTYRVVPWEYFSSAAEAIKTLKERVPHMQVISIELTDDAIPYTQHAYTKPLALVVGNETHGVSQEALKLSDAVVKLPMHGYNISLNVIVSAAVVAYHV